MLYFWKMDELILTDGLGHLVSALLCAFWRDFFTWFIRRAVWSKKCHEQRMSAWTNVTEGERGGGGVFGEIKLPPSQLILTVTSELHLVLEKRKQQQPQQQQQQQQHNKTVKIQVDKVFLHSMFSLHSSKVESQKLHSPLKINKAERVWSHKRSQATSAVRHSQSSMIWSVQRQTAHWLNGNLKPEVDYASHRWTIPSPFNEGLHDDNQPGNALCCQESHCQCSTLISTYVWPVTFCWPKIWATLFSRLLAHRACKWWRQIGSKQK